ncbi:family 78 glycoside hydrolase catalytic domain [Agromyces subbeticus]|uniref:family 78 glycoside hydrolase catalytic domain n=1 Tax=Agromyces subbeticus TaxID=293890 RepID=UPI0003B6A484|nr:family 78 glycoside hydrolase catalytic domain [Agromyces subbeticus]
MSLPNLTGVRPRRNALDTRRVVSAALAFALVTGFVAFDGAMTPAYAAATAEVTALKTDSTVNPLGITSLEPSFSWQLASTARDVMQSSYEVRVAASVDELGSNDVWSSGVVGSDRSIDVAYDGAALEPSTRYFWQVRVTTADGASTDWSAAAWFETALASTDDWEAEWIGVAPPAPWGDFEAEIDFTLKPGSAFGVYFRGDDALRNTYMWQLNDETAGTPKLRPHENTNGSYAVLGEIPLPAELGADVLKQRGTLRIVASGSQITTFVNDVQVDRRSDSSFATGGFGIRTSGAEQVTIHRVSATAGEATLLDADLAVDVNPFTAGTSVAGSGVVVAGGTNAVIRSAASSPMMRDEFTVDKPVASARLSASAQGVYEFSLNGARVGDHELAPGFTDYNLRTQYQTYDVTDQIQQGGNAIGVMAGPGWYAGNLGWFGPGQYGSLPSVTAQLSVDYEDGTRETFVTDDSWQSAPSPIISSDLLMGESYDARLEQEGWNTATFSPSGWSDVVVADGGTETLVPQVDPPVRVTQEVVPLSMTEPTAGRYVFDLGQNMVGKVRLQISGVAGQTVTLRHAEVVHADGTIAPENLRSAKATDTYTFAADGTISYEPRFTFHGFRYVELSGLSAPPTTAAVTGLVMNTDAEFSSTFETSDSMVNQLQSNIVWGQRGNWLSIPTDTPARDERLGWTGDINVFASTATFNMDSQTFLTKWMSDMRDAQLPNGAYPEVAPQFCKNPAVHSSCGGGSTGWADAGITVPWTLWQSYGDTDVIEENYDSMVDYIDYLEGIAPTGIRPGYGTWGDWLNLGDPTPADLLGTAFYAQSVNLMAQMAEAIDRPGDAARYRALFDTIRAAYQDEFIADDGSIAGDSQTAYTSSIAFGLVPDDLIDEAGEHLAAAVAARGGHLATGFLGTFNLLPALSAGGQSDVAYQLLLNRSYPSWGFQIDRGATTMWERWDSIREDGSFGDLAMNSFNHFAPGAVGNWMYRTIGGIQQLEPGYKKTLIAPTPGGGLQYAKVGYDSVYGHISSDWKLTDDGLALTVEVPANTTATVELPAGNTLAVLESGVAAADADGVHSLSVEAGTASIEVGSGRYEFTVDADRGRFGDLIAAIEALHGIVDDVESEIGGDAAAALTAAGEALTTLAASGLEHYTAGELAQSASAVHAALGELSAADETADAAVEPARAALQGALSDIRSELGSLSAGLLGVTAVLETPLQSAFPGETVAIPARVSSTGELGVEGVTLTPSAQDGWVFEPSAVELGGLGAGASLAGSYTALVPERQKSGAVTVKAVLDYTFEGTAASIPVSVPLMVDSPLVVANLTATPSTAAPENVVRLSVDVVNDSARDVMASARGGFDGATPVLGEQTVIAAGSTSVLGVDVVVPLATTAGANAVSVSVVSGEVVYGTASGTVAVALPAVTGAFDHVDLGNTASETAHALTASARSGTNTEAGLTRRYANREDPDGFFEFDLAVTPGEPFLVRTIETFDRAQTKEYDVFVNGELVHQRFYEHTGGLGTVAYQFVVDDVALTETGTVRIRFQNNETGRNYDASLADLWSLPVAADQLAPSVALEALAHGARGNGGWFTGAVDVSLTASDERQGTVTSEYRIDGAQWTGYTAPFTIEEEGETAIEYRATDAAGNVSEAKQATVRIDATAPAAAHTVSADAVGGWLASGTTLDITASDAGSGVAAIEYRLGAGAWTAYTSAIGLPLGSTVIEYRARDISGNGGAVTSAEFAVDGVGPIVTAERSSEPAASGWHLVSPTVELAASDAESGIGAVEYATGTGAWTPYTEAIGMPEGISELRFRASDAVGNVGETMIETIQVDSTRPEVGASMKGRALTLIGTDEGSGVDRIEFRLDDAEEWTRYTGAVVLDNRAHSIEFRASDVAGNVGAAGTRTVVGGSLSQAAAKPGDTITVTGEGFAPGETVTIELRSEPVRLGQAVADDAGAFSTSVTIPSDTATGEHHIVLTGEDPESTISFAITVDPDTVILPGGIATTGAVVAPALTLGLLLAAAGAALVIIRRRRHANGAAPMAPTS